MRRHQPLQSSLQNQSIRNQCSSGLTNSVGKNKKLAEDGAGAIVLKSLFEEQIMLEADQLKDPAFYPEASDDDRVSKRKPCESSF